MQELTRVRQYFEKIKKAEEPPAERTQTVNTEAAIRFIKADLVCAVNLWFPFPSVHCHTNRRVQADNQDINSKLKEQLAKERAKAAIKAARGDKGKKRSAQDSGGAPVAESSNVGSSTVNSPAEEIPEPERKKSKKSKSGKDKGEKKVKKDQKKN